MSNNQKFKIKLVKELLVGDIVLHPVYRPDGLLFVKKYKKLTDSIIKHIRNHFPANFPLLVTKSEEDLHFYIHQYHRLPKDVHQMLYKVFRIHQQYIQIPLSFEHYGIQSHSKNQKVIEDGYFLNDLHSKFLTPMWEVIEQTFDSKRILNRAKHINAKVNHLIRSDKSIQNLFSKIDEYHDALFVHSLNTTCISFMIGLSLELNDDSMVELVMATLFADIGYTEYPKDTFTQHINSGKLNETLMINHVKHSVEIIAQSPFCRRKNIVYGILDHHENFDGTGLPNKKKKDEIHLFGKIIAIAQLYDELTGGYIKENSMLSFEALEEVWKQRGIKLDPIIPRIFIDKANIYKMGEKIQLPSNEMATVIGFKDYINYPLHPIVIKSNGQMYDCTTRL